MFMCVCVPCVVIEHDTESRVGDPMLFAETPAQHMLGIISAVLGGKAPGVPTLLAVRDALHRSADVYRPTAEAMKLQLQANAVDVSGLPTLLCTLGHALSHSASLNNTRMEPLPMKPTLCVHGLSPSTANQHTPCIGVLLKPVCVHGLCVCLAGGSAYSAGCSAYRSRWYGPSIRRVWHRSVPMSQMPCHRCHVTEASLKQMHLRCYSVFTAYPQNSSLPRKSESRTHTHTHTHTHTYICQ